MFIAFRAILQSRAVRTQCVEVAQQINIDRNERKMRGPTNFGSTFSSSTSSAWWVSETPSFTSEVALPDPLLCYANEWR